MPTTHTWKPTNSGYIYDVANHTDGAPFADGDTYVFSGGTPNAAGVNGNIGALNNANYTFNPSSASTGLSFTNIRLSAASTLGVAGPQVMHWQGDGQFINDGSVQLGSAAGSGRVFYTLFNGQVTTPASITNNNTIALTNRSAIQFDALSHGNDVFLNSAGAVLSISGGSAFDNITTVTGYELYSPLIITNNGLIEVTGAPGLQTRFRTTNAYPGSGLLSVRGNPGASAGDTYAALQSNINGTFDIASGTLEFTKSATAGSPIMGGTVNFLDNNAEFYAIDQAAAPTGTVVGATITGFQAGDTIILNEYAKATGFSYDPGTHKLTITLQFGSVAGTAPPVQFTFAGLSLADAQSKLSVSSGVAGGRNYLYVHYN